jgi:hypothetical protein
MTEDTIRGMAKELAGQFYEMVRSAESLGEKVQVERRGRVLMKIDPRAFARTFPTVQDYLGGRRHGLLHRHPDGTVTHVDDGVVRVTTPGWMHWVATARETLVSMLGNPLVHQNVKDAIADAVIEDRTKQLKMQAARIKLPNVPQRKSLRH